MLDIRQGAECWMSGGLDVILVILVMLHFTVTTFFATSSVSVEVTSFLPINLLFSQNRSILNLSLT